MIHIYESQTAPPHRRFLAQFEKVKDNLYLTIHGPTAEIAEAKARLLLDYQNTPPEGRKAFDLKSRLAALGDEGYEDLL